MSILDFLGLKSTAPEPQHNRGETDTVRKIVARLDGLPEDKARFVAAFAFMLSRVAHADLDISDEETRVMEQIVVEPGGLPEEQATIVVQMAKTQNLLFGGTENYLVAKEFNRIATREQKLSLLHCLFAVGAADDSISATENNVVRQIAEELNLEHADFIAVRSRFREHLAVFRRPDSTD
ncbi:MAG: TerB family tellurite resistance protein [Acidobacteria bacterium]|nr:MAG: TerB family tellurite resistance protein [Acidobacteriota bacterium]